LDTSRLEKTKGQKEVERSHTVYVVGRPAVYPMQSWNLVKAVAKGIRYPGVLPIS
jgi:hypothetical protein